MQNEKHRCSDFTVFFLPPVDICDPKTRFQNKDKQKPMGLALVVFVED